MSCVYAITNLKTGKQYIGSTKNFTKRKFDHVRKLNRNVHENRYLQRAWNKHKASSFEFRVVEPVDERFLVEAEQKWIDNSAPKYNLSLIAGRPMVLFGKDHPMYGKFHSKETKEKMSLARARSGLSKGSKNPFYGIHKFGKDNPNFGKQLSKEARKQIADSRSKYIGRKAANWKGCWVTPIGKFDICEEASKLTKVSIPTLIKLCKTHNNVPFTPQTVSHNKSLVSMIVGQTPKQLGFGFKHINI